MDKQNDAAAQTTSGDSVRENANSQTPVTKGVDGSRKAPHPDEQVSQRINGAINLDLVRSGVVSTSNVFTDRGGYGRLTQPDSDFEGRTCLAVNEAGGVSLVVLKLAPNEPLPQEIWTVSNGVWSRIHHLIEWSAFRQLVYRCGEAVTAAGIPWNPVTALAAATVGCAQATDWAWPPDEPFNVIRFHEAVMQLAPLCPVEQDMDGTWSYDEAGSREYVDLVNDDPAEREGAVGETQKGEKAA